MPYCPYWPWLCPLMKLEFVFREDLVWGSDGIRNPDHAHWTFSFPRPPLGQYTRLPPVTRHGGRSTHETSRPDDTGPKPPDTRGNISRWRTTLRPGYRPLYPDKDHPESGPDAPWPRRPAPFVRTPSFVGGERRHFTGDYLHAVGRKDSPGRRHYPDIAIASVTQSLAGDMAISTLFKNISIHRRDPYQCSEWSWQTLRNPVLMMSRDLGL